MKLNCIILAGIAATALSLPAPTNLKADDQYRSVKENQTQALSDINKTSRFIGMPVKNQSGEKLGKVKDVVLNLESGEVAYVVLAKSSVKHGTGKYLALPLDVFSPSSDQKHLVLNADKERVSNAKGFAANNWPSIENATFGGSSSMDGIIIFKRPELKDNPKDEQQKDEQEQENQKDQKDDQDDEDQD